MSGTSGIQGYRTLNDAEIHLVNEVKNLAAIVGKFVDRVHNTPSVDPRWASIARTDLQTGFMALVRAITQPTTF